MYQRITKLITEANDARLTAVEEEFRSSSHPSEHALLAWTINETLRTAVRMHRCYPKVPGDELLSYRHGDSWKYTFASPMMITRKASDFLFAGGKARDKAVNHIPGYKNGQVVIIHGEHVVPTSEQRRILPAKLAEMDDLGLIDHVQHPHTAYARQLLNMNMVVCTHASEVTHLSNSTMPDQSDPWSRYHSHQEYTDLVPFMIRRSLMVGANAKNFHCWPEHIDKYADKCRSATTADEFFELMTQA